MVNMVPREFQGQKPKGPQEQFSPGYPPGFPTYYHSFKPHTSNWDSLAAYITPRNYSGEYTPSAFTILTVLIPVY